MRLPMIRGNHRNKPRSGNVAQHRQGKGGIFSLRFLGGDCGIMEYVRVDGLLVSVTSFSNKTT